MSSDTMNYDTDKIKDGSVKAWFVMNMYTKSLAKVEYSLEMSGLKYFVARCNKLKKCGGKTLKVRKNIIPGIFFIYATYQEVQCFQSMYDFLGFATYRLNGRRLIMKVPANEMNNFISFVDNCNSEINFFRPDEITLEKGTKVRLTGGDMDGVECYLTRFKGKRKKILAVSIPSLGTFTTVFVQPDFVEII